MWTDQISLDEFLDDVEPSMKTKFLRFHRQYPEVYRMFKKITLEAIKKGFKNYGSKGICERIRWETKGDVKEDGYKINNNYTAFYARLFEKEHPNHEGFFRKRKVKQELT